MFYKVIITESLSKLNENLSDYLSIEKLESLCASEGLKWRKRILSPGITIHLFLLQIVNKNTACSHVRQLGNFEFTAMAYCKARFRVPLKVIEKLFNNLVGDSKCSLWKGHRVWLEDGTGCSMPDTESLRKHFGQPGGQKDGCGFPVASVLLLVDAATGMLSKMLTSPLRTHDLTRAIELYPELEEGDVVVGDRGFCSFAHLMLLCQRGIHAVFRVNSGLDVDFRKALRSLNNERVFVRGERIRKLGKTDQLIYWQKTLYLPKWMSKEQFSSLPELLVVRELRYKLNRKGFRSTDITLVTTLIDSEAYPKVEIAELYGLRWEIETNIRHLKITLGADVLHCKTVDGVLKELFAFCIVYNLIRLVMLESAKRRNLHPARISFVDAMRWLQIGSSESSISKLIVNPIRKGRTSPRIVKRRPKAYPRMTKPRNTFQGFTLAEQTLTA